MDIGLADPNNVVWFAVLYANFGEHGGVLDLRAIRHDGWTDDHPRWAGVEALQLGERLDLERDQLPDGVSVLVAGCEYKPDYWGDSYVEYPVVIATRPAPAPGLPWWRGTKEDVATYVAGEELAVAWWEAMAIDDFMDKTPENLDRFVRLMAEVKQGWAMQHALMAV